MLFSLAIFKIFCITIYFLDLRKPFLSNDVMQASFNSFISQECDTDIKYSLQSARANSIPLVIVARLRDRSGVLKDGYFNKKYLPGNANRKLNDMVKYCIEPFRMSHGDATRVSYFNRTSRSSLYPERIISGYPAYKHISGLAMVVDRKHRVVAAYFALPSSTIGYRRVFYRRWKGMGFEDAV